MVLTDPSALLIEAVVAGVVAGVVLSLFAGGR